MRRLVVVTSVLAAIAAGTAMIPSIASGDGECFDSLAGELRIETLPEPAGAALAREVALDHSANGRVLGHRFGLVTGNAAVVSDGRRAFVVAVADDVKERTTRGIRMTAPCLVVVTDENGQYLFDFRHMRPVEETP